MKLGVGSRTLVWAHPYHGYIWYSETHGVSVGNANTLEHVVLKRGNWRFLQIHLSAFRGYCIIFNRCEITYVMVAIMDF